MLVELALMPAKEWKGAVPHLPGARLALSLRIIQGSYGKDGEL